MRRKLFNFVVILALFFSTTACSNYRYKEYDAVVEPGVTNPLDVTQGNEDFAVVYFNSYTTSTVGVPYHRLLLVTHLNGKPLPEAGRKSALDVTGYQALKLPAGENHLRWCFLSMNGMGTGGANCNFAERFDFDSGEEYLVSWDSKMSKAGNKYYSHMQMYVTNVDTGETLSFVPAPNKTAVQ